MPYTGWQHAIDWLRTSEEISAAKAQRFHRHFRNIYTNEFPGWEFTQENEIILRQLLFQVWQQYFQQRHQRTVALVDKLPNNSPQRQRLCRSKFYRLTTPQDLSGACKIAAQVAYVVFPLAGVVVSNKHHTFILLDGGEIYDINRDCQDVGNQVRKGRRSYAVNWQYHNSAESLAGLVSWDKIIAKVLALVNNYQQPRQQQLPRRCTTLPDWSRSAYIKPGDKLSLQIKSAETSTGRGQCTTARG